MKHKEKFIAKGVGAGLVSARKERGITLIALVITIVLNCSYLAMERII